MGEIGKGILAGLALLAGAGSLGVNAQLVRVVERGGMEAAQWQMALPPCILGAVLAAGVGGWALVRRPGWIPKYLISGLMVANGLLVGWLVFRLEGG